MYPWNGRSNTVESGSRPFFSNSFQYHQGTNLQSGSFFGLNPYNEPQRFMPNTLGPSQLNISDPVPYLTNSSLCYRSVQERLQERAGNLFSNRELNQTDSSFPVQRDVSKFMFKSKERSNVHGNSQEGSDDDDDDDDIFGVQEPTKAKQTKPRESAGSVGSDFRSRKTIRRSPRNKQTRQVNGSGCLEIHSEKNSVDKTIRKCPKNKQTCQVNGSICSEVHSKDNSLDKTIGKHSKNKQMHQVNRSACSEVHSEENSVDIKEKRLSIITRKNKNEITNSTISKPIGKITPNIKKVTLMKKGKQTTEDFAKGDSMDMKVNKSIKRKRKEGNGCMEMDKVTPKIKTVIENNKVLELQLNSKIKQPKKRKYGAQHKEEETPVIKKKCSKIKTVPHIDDQSGFQASLPFEEMLFHQLQPGVLSTCAISAKDTTCGYILIQSNSCLTSKSEMTSSITFSLVKGSLTVIQNGKTYIVNKGSFIYISDNPYSFKNNTAEEVLLSYSKSS